jgi:hypothetical protein
VIAVEWKGKKEICILTNMHLPPVEQSFQEEHDKAIKPTVAESYSLNMGNKMANILCY